MKGGIKLNQIARIRKKFGITQQQLSERLEVDRSTIAKWESGESMPRADKLPELAKILNCSIDELFQLENKPA